MSQLEFQFPVPPEIAEPVESRYISDKIKKPEFFLYRIDNRGDRHYVRLDDAYEYNSAPSVTTIIGKVSPMSQGLLKWYCDLGWQKAHEVMAEKAHYGTFMHIMFANFLVTKFCETRDKSIDLAIESYCSKKEIEVASINQKKWRRDIKKDLIGFAHWVKDYQVTPLAVEHGLWAGRYAGVLDLVCEVTMYENGKPETKEKRAKRYTARAENWRRKMMKWLGLTRKANEKKMLVTPERARRYTVVIDWKSRRGEGVFDDWESQLDAYYNAWNKQHPESPATKKYIYHPRDFSLPLAFTGKPYAFIEIKGDRRKKWAHYLGLFFDDESNQIKETSRIADVAINLDEPLPNFVETYHPVQRLRESIDEQRKVDEHA